jgi:hypothetical protein
MDLDDPSLWPFINSYRFSSYFIVATFVGLLYDWALTFGLEVELIWKHHWSIMTVLYISVRYLGILYAVLAILYSVPTISLTDTGCYIINVMWNWTSVVVFAMLKILSFIIVTFLAVNIFGGIVVVMIIMHTSGVELILSGTRQCAVDYIADIPLLNSIDWILFLVWEVLALCHTVWTAVKHFREQRQHSTRRIVRDCFTMLIKTHMLYFASMVVASCFTFIVAFSTDTLSLESQIDFGLLQILEVVQFVLGPRLILSIREYHAKLVANSDAATGVTSIAFQERADISTSSSV